MSKMPKTFDFRGNLHRIVSTLVSDVPIKDVAKRLVKSNEVGSCTLFSARRLSRERGVVDDGGHTFDSRYLHI